MSCEYLGNALSEEILVERLLPIVMRMGKDSVPNIRFNVCKSLAKMCAMCKGNMKAVGDIEGVMKGMLEDEDRDVRHFAKVGLGEIGGIEVQ